MNPQIVLGIDGGLAHLGWSVAFVRPGAAKPVDVQAGGVIETKKRSIGTVAESHAIRAAELHRALVYIVEGHQPASICAEAFSPPRNAATASMLAWSWGVLCAVADRYKLPISAKSPMPLKRALTGEPTAKKDQMIAAVREQYPETADMFPERADLHEHFADAVAAIHFFHGPASSAPHWPQSGAARARAAR